MTRKRLIALSVVMSMVLMLFLASCGADDQPSSSDGGSTITTEIEEENDETEDSSSNDTEATGEEVVADEESSETGADTTTGEAEETEESDDDSESEDVLTQASWSASSDCTTCHTTEAESAEDSSCLSGYHMTEQGFTCTTCHSDTETLAEVHADVEEGDRTPKRLKSTEIDSTLCTTCHDEASLVEATADSTVLTDSEGTVVNPHDLTENETHLEAATTCVDCHSGHDTDGIETTALAYCTSCHHENVFECYTCH